MWGKVFKVGTVEKAIESPCDMRVEKLGILGVVEYSRDRYLEICEKSEVGGGTVNQN